jgi:outer membrane protein, heavy metal efflux system
MRTLGLLLAAGLVGCQAYRASPLDLPSHGRAWSLRSPASPGVVAYAGRLATTAPAARSGYDPADGLTLREAEVVALFFNPRLRAARLRARVPAAGAAEAGRWEDPVLEVDAERIVQSVSHPWVVGGMLNVTLPLSGRLALERGRALAEADVARGNALLEEQRVLADLAAAWAELRVIDERITLARAFLSDLDQVASQAERLRQAGELSPVEAGLFRVEQIRRRVEARAEARQPAAPATRA